MKRRKVTASVELLELLEIELDCSDKQAAELLRVSRSRISHWRGGIGHMSTAQVERACKLTGRMPEVWYWIVRVTGEREAGADGAIFRRALRELGRSITIQSKAAA